MSVRLFSDKPFFGLFVNARSEFSRACLHYDYNDVEVGLYLFGYQWKERTRSYVHLPSLKHSFNFSMIYQETQRI